ncbi:type I restriction-modification system subunit M [Adhaeribacter soli]|uniref:site-specific DNA-methyltransferase (adenine-specific) n=1 Tax=Adhaeribacter soli TaxID=2607655 RepID=A0A5N1IM94_9BACT|nr:class I SAM-dependent DNA methyltransferase [Adhaeribacter soli]KAA9331144.1 SAM-dependent DNA methyltransferase [Adhaeribacter soli]
MITKQALGNTLFGMADILRDKVEDYKAYILSLLFFKRLSDNYDWESTKVLKEAEETFGKLNQKQIDKILLDAHDFKIPAKCHWKDVREASMDKKNDVLNRAVNSIADHNPDLKGVINTVRWNEPSPDGSGGKKLHPEVLSLLVNYLDAVDLSNKNASVDILGDAYEYLIKRFADENKGGTTAGQFYTPQEVVDIIVRYLKPQKGHTVYDPTCGSGGFLINAAKYIKKTTGSQKNIRLYGQEDVWNTWAICNINMILHGLDASIKKGDTLKDPKFTKPDNELEIEQFDNVMANFPFSQENWWKNGEPKKDKKGKVVNKKDGSPQLAYPKEGFSDPYERFEYGNPPFSNGDFAFLQHIVASMKPNGKAGIVCPQGILFRGQPEKTEEEDGQRRKADDEYLIRRGFLKGKVEDDGELTEAHNIVDAIVELPGNLFYGTTIPGSILFLNKNKTEERKEKVLMVYAAKQGWYKEEANMNILLPHDVLRISTILESWGDLEIAKVWITDQKGRLRGVIQEELDFKLAALDQEYNEDLEMLETKLSTAKEAIFKKKQEDKKPTQSQLKAVESAQTIFDKMIREKADKIQTAHNLAEKERNAIDDVEQEILNMLQDLELQKRYFAVVDMNELEENEFNLNIPRYVETFEPEEELDLKVIIEEFNQITSSETKADSILADLLKTLA